MNYSLLQLRFNGAVHFGGSESATSLSDAEDHIRADTLFSALAHMALLRDGEDRLLRLCDCVKQGKLLFSDTFPWKGDRFYLPKPYITSENAEELPSDLRKAIKKLVWIPAEQFAFFESSVAGKRLFVPDEVSFGRRTEVTKAAIQPGKDALPYSVGLFSFDSDCGLYFIMAAENTEITEYILSLLEILGQNGIGGKVSSGYGKFQTEDHIILNEPFDSQTEWMYNALTTPGKASLLLTTALPCEHELCQAMDGATYQMIRRSGFVASEQFDRTNRKKQTQYFFTAGSVFRSRFTGELYQVGIAGTHPVYRYSKPLFMGVDL